MDVARLSMVVDSRQVQRATTHLDRFSGAGRKAATSATTTQKATAVMGGAMAQAARQVAAATGALVGLGAAFRNAQQYAQITNSFRALGQSGQEAARSLQAVADVANRTRAPLDATAKLYQRITIAGKDLGASQQQILRFTENVGLALAQTGTSSQEASGALLQLSQAMSGGVVRAEEFNSILEGAFPIAQAAADGIDEAAGSVGRLRNMVIEGKVSSDEFFDAILSQTGALEAAFANTTPTIGQALTVLSTNFTMLVGSMDEVAGASAAVARGIILAGENLARIATYAATAATVFGVRYVGALVVARVATLGLAGSLAVVRGALIRTGIGALVVGAGELVYQFGRLVQATGGFGAAMSALGEVAGAVWQGIIDSAQAIPPALASIWQTLVYQFNRAVSSMVGAWSDFLLTVASGAEGLESITVMGIEPFEGMANGIRRAAAGAGRASADIMDTASTAFKAAADAAETAGGAVTGAFTPAREAAAKLATTVATAAGETEGAATAADRLNDALSGLGGSGAGGSGGSAGAAGKRLKEAATQAEGFQAALAEAAMTAEDMGREKAGILVRGIDGIAGAWGDFVANGFRDFKGFVQSVWDSFKGLISQMVALAARNRIMLSLGIGGGAAGGVAGAATGGGGGIGGLLGGAGGMLGTLGSAAAGTAGTVGTGFIGAAGNALGIGAAGFNPLAIGTNAAMAGGGFMATLGAAMPLIAGVGLVIGLFSKKTKELDRGVRVTVDGMDALVEQFRKTETSRLFGLLRSRRTSYDRASEEIADPITSAVRQVQTSIMDTASVLGIGADAFEGFSHRFRLSLKGMDEEEQQAAISEALGELGDEFAALALAGHDVAREGEGATETLERLATSLVGVNRITDMLGHHMFEASVAGADMASSLAEAFGGLQAMDSATTKFFNAFYSEQEQLAAITRRATAALAEHNIRLPETRNEYRALVDAQDLTTASGREAYAALVGLADTMDRLLPAIGNVNAAIAGLIGQTTGVVGTMMEEVRGVAQEAGRAAQDWYRAADSLRRFIRDLTGSQQSALTPGQQFRALQRDLRQTFTAARGGDIDAARDFPGVAQDFLRSARAQASTALEFRRIESRVRGQANLLAGISELEGASRTVMEDLAMQQLGVLQELSDYLQSTDSIDPDDIASFEGRLGSLQRAIEQAEMFSYEFLKERLKVSVDLLVGADIPADVRRMVANAETGIESTIDFAVRSQALTPDLRWLAVQGASEHVKTIRYLADNDLTPQTMRLALAGSDSIQRTIRLVAASELDSDEKRLALAGSSELMRTVNVMLASGADPRAIELLDLVRGASAGTVTLAGGVRFDPSAAFASDLSDNIRTPLREMHSELADLLGRISDALRDAQRQQQLSAMSAYTASLPQNAVGQTFMDRSEIMRAAALGGIDTEGMNLGDVAWHIANASRGDSLERVFMDPDHRARQAFAASGATHRYTRGDFAISYPDPARPFWTRLEGPRGGTRTGWEHEMFALMDDVILGKVPAFAGGGYTGDAPRSGGLDGRGGFLAMMHPRETVTDHTRQRPDDSLMRELLAEVKALREEQRQFGLRSDRHEKRTSDILRKWDQIGLPQEQDA
ncbi:MAG: tape measure protein [Rhodosalinus sp.]